MVMAFQKSRIFQAFPQWIRRAGARLWWAGFWPAYYAGMAGLCLVAYAAKDLPSTHSFWDQSRPISVQIIDRNGRDIVVRGANEANPVRLSHVSLPMQQAVLAIEDRRFYNHIGIDPKGLARAAHANWRAGRVVQGGSTLTQQLAKNVFLSSERTLSRKLQETLLAIWLERTFSKDEIFEKYLSRVYFGGSAWGLEAASQQYFRKSTAELNLGEAAMIAALLKGPTRYNPVASPERAAGRTAIVLAAMERAQFITRSQRQKALTTPIHVFQPENNDDSAHYFVDWIWDEMVDLIGTPSTDIVVRTTLDIAAQRQGTTAIKAHLDPERGANQAALITLDGTGGVRAMIGGRSYTESQFNRAVQAERQPGSAFKPFVYLAAFNAGLTPWDIRTDEPIDIDGWQPGNFTNTFQGDMTLETAFAKSVNTVAVTLSEELGRKRIAEAAGIMGLNGLEPLRSLPLGAQTTTPLALTSAYLPFASWGNAASAHGILSISSADGTPIYDRSSEAAVKVVDAQSLGHMNRVMMETVRSGTARRAALPGRDVGGKTGTTNDYRDAWFVGYVPDRVTGVWVGSDDNAPMKRVTGGTIPASIWHDMMAAHTEAMPASRLPVSEPPLRFEPEPALNLLLSDIETTLP